MTMELVAKVAGVSQGTVSKVVNNRPGVSEETVRIVREAIRRVGYEPGPGGPRRGRPSAAQRRRMTQKSTGNIGLLIMGSAPISPGARGFSELLAGVTSAAREHGRQVIVDSITSAEELPSAVANRQVDGVLLVGCGGQGDIIKKLNSLPSVCLMEAGRAPLTVDHVLEDNSIIGGLAAEYLMRLGCRELLFLNHMTDRRGFDTRRRAFEQLAKEAGVDIQALVKEPGEGDDSGTWQVGQAREELAKLLDKAFNGGRHPDGLFVPTDQQAAFVYPLLSSRGVEPGRDVVVISCDGDEAWLATMHPRPATIDIGVEEIGRRGVERLLHRLEHPDEKPLRILVAPRLVEPETAQTPKGTGKEGVKQFG